MPKEELCYLDGRYFNIMLEEYKELHPYPLYVRITDNDDSKMRLDMKMTRLPPKGVTKVFRLIFEYYNRDKCEIRHTNLIISINNELYRFDALGYSYLSFVSPLVAKFFNMKINDVAVSYVVPENNPKCAKSGFCNAYVIKYALSWLKNVKYDPSNIIKFAKSIVKRHRYKLTGEPDIEYGLNGTTTGLLIGGLAGAGVGGLLLGWPGALIGGALGAAGGAAVGYSVSKNNTSPDT